MDRAPATSPMPPPARRLLRVALGTVLFVAFGFLGRLTVIDETSLSLIWPAAGVAALWLSTGDRRTWPTDFAALAVASFGVNVVTGASVPAGLGFAASNTLQVALFVLLTRRWTTDVWGLGGHVPLHRLADLGRLVAISALACLAGALTGALALWAAHADFAPISVAVWWGRNSVSMVVITVFGLIAGPPLFAATGAKDLARILYDAARARTLARLVEAELLVATTVGLYAAIFGERTAEPLSFLVLSVSIWAGLRFTPTAVMVHGLAIGAAGLLFTLNGLGPLADIHSPHYRALVAQVFMATTVLTGLALAFSRVERDQATRHLRQARRESDERTRLLRAVLDSMNEGLVVVEEGGRIVLTNAATPILLGIEDLHRSLRPAATYGLYHADGTPLSDDDLPGLRTLDGEAVPPADFHLRADAVPQGRVLEIGVEPLPQLNPDDRPLAMINIRDVTLDRQHRDALASFAGVVAHDLFNPLTVVSGWAEALEEELADGAVTADVGMPMVRHLQDAANHMRHVIGDLLAYTVARDQSLRPGPVDLTAEIRALARLREEGPEPPIISVAPAMEVWADPVLARQLFDNLLGNAVKYVAPGVRPRVDVRGHRDHDWLEVRVTDNGIGIPDDQRDLVFETFHRAHRDGYQGTGLGLAICRRIADRHGGSIHAEQGPDGLGTTFVVRLPANAAGYAKAAQPLRAAPTPSPEEQSA
ncbi:ATP-binding protein [Nocardioides pocheonensis]|nr:ATP-binding protein [Nocardioides pocheonensis]